MKSKLKLLKLKKIILLLFINFQFFAIANNRIKETSIFIDAKVEQQDLILKALQPNNKTDFNLFSHARSGELLINQKWKNAKEIADFLNSEFNIQYALFSQLNIYGCEFAKGEKGLAAVSYLEKVLGLQVNASTNITGIDGDWLLEVGCYNRELGIVNYQYNLQSCEGELGGTAETDDYDSDGICNVDDLDDDNDGILDVEECGFGNGTVQSPFTNLYEANKVETSGRYYFDLGSGVFQADVDTSNGGGWVMVLQYVHEGGTNPDLKVLGAGANLPITNGTLGEDESNSTTSWGHLGNAGFSDLGAEELRWYGVTSGHSRIVHFSSSVGINYVATGIGSFEGIESNNQKLVGHTASSPDNSETFFSDEGDSSLVLFPLLYIRKG